MFKEPLTWSPVPSNNDDVGGSGATPPVYIVTGSCDSNRNYCYNALCCFKELEYTVFFDDLKGVDHEYQYASTYDIWTFFKLYRRQI